MGQREGPMARLQNAKKMAPEPYGPPHAFWARAPPGDEDALATKRGEPAPKTSALAPRPPSGRPNVCEFMQVGLEAPDLHRSAFTENIYARIPEGAPAPALSLGILRCSSYMSIVIMYKSQPVGMGHHVFCA